jgi:hypothetical protein
MAKHKMELNRIKFEISLRFDECDVDVIFANECQWVPHHKNVEGSSTPTESSVARYLDILFQVSFDGGFGKAKMVKSYGLMMGFCSATFEVDPDEVSFEELPAVIENCKIIMRKHMNRIGYYKTGTTVGRSMGLVCATG